MQRIIAGVAERTYAGIGARETPAEVLALMRELARALGADGWVLRSGMSPGADRAFYQGALAGGGRIELFLPWPGFGADARAADEPAGQVYELERPLPAARQLAELYCAAFAELEPVQQALLARDSHQVLGRALVQPIDAVVCWTPDGDLDGRGERSAGTGQALRVARARAPGATVLNLAREEHRARLERCLGSASG